MPEPFVRTGVIVTEEEARSIELAMKTSGMFLSGGQPIGTPKQDVYAIAKNYGLPEIEGTYGFDGRNREIIAPLDQLPDGWEDGVRDAAKERELDESADLAEVKLPFAKGTRVVMDEATVCGVRIPGFDGSWAIVNGITDAKMPDLVFVDVNLRGSLTGGAFDRTCLREVTFPDATPNDHSDTKLGQAIREFVVFNDPYSVMKSERDEACARLDRIAVRCEACKGSGYAHPDTIHTDDPDDSPCEQCEGVGFVSRESTPLAQILKYCRETCEGAPMGHPSYETAWHILHIVGEVG